MNLQRRPQRLLVLLSLYFSLLLLLLLLSVADGAPLPAGESWNSRALRSYPGHLLVRSCPEGVSIDGSLEDACWRRAHWSAIDKDIAESLYPSQGQPTFPSADGLFETRVGVAFDSDFFYMAAVLGEPSPSPRSSRVTGHNAASGVAPYADNDVEIFVNPSGSNHFYVEFEGNARNATYDVLWRSTPAADNEYGTPCEQNSTECWCCISSSPGCPHSRENWTMFGGSTGLRSAVSYDDSYYALEYEKGSKSETYEPFTVDELVEWKRGGGVNHWTMEVRFPLRPGPGHGSILDNGTGTDVRYDPNVYYSEKSRGGTSIDRPLTWRIDFARAEHIMAFHGDGIAMPTTDKKLCERTMSDPRSRTLLGDDPWNCYFEWVSAPTGGSRYMHFPEYWMFAEFEDPIDPMPPWGAAPCRDITWPGRLLAREIFFSQMTSMFMTGTYQPSAEHLLPFCIGRSETKDFGRGMCEPGTLAAAIANANVEVHLATPASSSGDCENSCSTPSYEATVTIMTDDALCEARGAGSTESFGNASVRVPWYSVAINQDKLVSVHVHRPDFCMCLRALDD